ncbi:hypothetical protein CC78DRAFT_523484 [Lojkania enalia]|uniref:Cyclase n=1 Tax=Lojkania enalia TaxID=147567 RepID=A0A9P4K536_9PLEO|nr:hypothetical protein CC78DRAFT_523484 [Didymosphaeria enalia]
MVRLDPNGDTSTFPKRSHLPHVSGTPQGAAWFWGGNDELGRLNLLTPQRILKATQSCVRTGHVVSLNLALSQPDPELLGRKTLKHRMHLLTDGRFDDELSLNMQSSSQWNGFRHFADPRTGFFYNGVTSDLIAPDEGEEPRTTKLGIDVWAKRGIVGRGVLLDVFTWKKEAYDPFTTELITAGDLKRCAESQNVSFETGDILLVRTGWLHKYHSLTDAERKKKAEIDMMQHKYVGLESSDAMKDFLHDMYFAAAVTDSLNFEAWPPISFEGSLHASMLPLWGMPIGELWDLEALAEQCRGTHRWDFLLTSAPGNVPGGVGSPPNALAIF